MGNRGRNDSPLHRSTDTIVAETLIGQIRSAEKPNPMNLSSQTIKTVGLLVLCLLGCNGRSLGQTWLAYENPVFSTGFEAEEGDRKSVV